MGRNGPARQVPLALLVTFVALACANGATRASAQDRLIELSFMPTERAQIAIWIETAEGEYVQTIRLSDATARRGIGNRPGALQMNSGYRWPYGRREGTLPVWAHRRDEGTGASFQRVIFQNRASEGFASRTTNDASPDDYYCLSFNAANSARDALDAVTCASQFNSDKGRFITEADIAAGYAEPFENETGTETSMRALTLTSLYPPRRDLSATAGADAADLLGYATHAREVMPEIDAVTMATLPGEETRTIQFTVPNSWAGGDYVVYLEINTEGDYNESYQPPERFPTPTLGAEWDYWSKNYGYPYRSQPSVVYAVPFSLDTAATYSTGVPAGYGDVQGLDGELHTMDASISDAPESAPGSGADRLRVMDSSARLQVRVVQANVCTGDDPPPECFQECDALTDPCAIGFICHEGECIGECDLGEAPDAVSALEVSADADKSWRWATLRFVVPESSTEIREIQVRTSTEPFVPGSSDFGSWGVEALVPDPDNEDDQFALTLTSEDDELRAGEALELTLAGFAAQTPYYVAVRSVDGCNRASEVQVAEFATTEIIFTTVTPCFIATASYGSSMAHELGPLRRFRDRYLMSNGPGRALVDLYYEHSPALAHAIAQDEDRRAMARELLAPIVDFARWATD